MTGLTTTRPDHGAMHQGNYCAYVRVSTEKQDNVNQEAVIKAYLNGGDYSVEWFADECSSGTPWDRREGLQDCINHARKTGATMIIYSVSRMSRTTWEALRFLEQEVKTGKVKLVVVDNPHLDHNTVGLLAAVAEMERTHIKARTKAALGRIKQEIEENGSYVARSGRTITKLGAASLTDAGRAGNEANAKKAKGYALQLETLFKSFVSQGMSYRAMADELNKIGIDTPRKAADPDLLNAPEWHGSSARNYVQRLIKMGSIVPKEKS